MLISVRKMKLKQLAEDFRVEEISKFNILKNGSYKIYLLEKKGLETFSLLSYLSRKNRIPASEFGIAGLKDKPVVKDRHYVVNREQKDRIKAIINKNNPDKLGLRGDFWSPTS